MKWTFLLSLSFFISACSNLESHQAKMNRYQPHTTVGSNNVYFSLNHFQFEKITKSRGPASKNEKVKINDDKNNEVVNESNKRIYFKTLNDQYQVLRSYFPTEQRNALNSCPHFHSYFLENKNKEIVSKKVSFQYDLNKINDQEYTEKFPELYLPIDDKMTVLDELKSQKKISEDRISQAVSKKLKSLSNEITELCQYGASDNYYAFENLYSHTKTHSFEANRENLNILLKTTVFYYQALISSFAKKEGQIHRKIASTDDQFSLREIEQKFGVEWSNEYFQSLK